MYHFSQNVTLKMQRNETFCLAQKPIIPFPKLRIPLGEGERAFLSIVFKKPLLLQLENLETRGTEENCTMMSAFIFSVFCWDII